ncbi:MAG TPA: protein kinase [Planctomycetota bacterium]|nr:protein kinase [Planctomycetota bacterium]
MSEPTDKQPLFFDQGSHETAALYVPANRLAKVDAIDVFTPIGNRVMPREQAIAPTAIHEREGTLVMPLTGSSSRGTGSSSGTGATSVLKRLHGSDSDELFAAALRSKQDSLISGNTPRFNLVGKLGEGSQGIVYRVNDRDCHREVACKVLSYATSDPEEISRFIHEAQVTAQLEHPGVVPIHDLGELRDGTVYYTMKRVDGVSMLDLLTAKGGKTEHRYELLEMFLRICETMAFAHSRGVVHRDLKPRNIMAGPFGEVLVLDWGLAKVVNCVDVARPMGTMRSFPEADAYRTLNGTAVGTPAYMSPEQAMGEVDTLDRRCDVYSLGVILYEILAGASPYVRGEARKVMHQVSHGMWTRLDTRRDCSPLPRALVAITHRAMAFERPDRYQTVEELSRDLRAFIAGGAVSVYRETAVERLARVITHHKRQVRTGVAVAGVAALFGIGIWANQWYDQERTITGLRAQMDERLAQRDYVEARAYVDRILTLRPDDRATRFQSARIEEGLRNLEQAQRLAAKRAEADDLIHKARVVAQTNDEASLGKAGELYMQAFGLVGDDQTITAAYQDVSRRLAALEQQRREAENLERKRLAALRQIESAKRDLHWAQPIRNDLALKNKERRALEAANRSSDDPTLRSRLHTLEERIEAQRKELAAFEGRAANSYDQAIVFAPADDSVRAAVADYYMEQMLDYEARGEMAGALMAENRCRMFDQGRYTEVLSGQSWVHAAKGQLPVTIQLLSEGAERTLEPEREVYPVPEDSERALLHGRYLVRNALGTVKAVRLRRGDHLELLLPAPPATLPEQVAFIPGGAVIDSDGSALEEVPAFALARREVTCGEWLAFLNDSQTRAQIDEAERAGNRVLVPRENDKLLWLRTAEGTYHLPSVDAGVQVDAAWPVSHISGRDALAYVKWLARRDQLPWRLPTHGEWLLAAQGGDGRPFPWGLRAELGFSASALGSPQGPWCTSPVGTHPKDRSVQGVMDLGGSVAELVLVDGAVRLAAGGSHRDRQPDAFGVFSFRDVADSQPESGVGLRLAFTVPGPTR